MHPPHPDVPLINPKQICFFCIFLFIYNNFCIIVAKVKSTMKNKFLQEMQDRGYLNQCTDIGKLDEICNKKSISGYIGSDCTASSLHVGSLLQIMILRLMQKHGHRPIVLLGGGTTLIGDPSGKDATRKILDQVKIKKNIKSIKKVFNKILNTSDKKNFSNFFVNNADWLYKIKLHSLSKRYRKSFYN